jgi:hypothetical protein
MCQGDDEDLMLELGEVLFPGSIARSSDENGLRIWVDRDPCDPVAADEARAIFQTVLGLLRAWRLGAGQLKEEERPGLGEGPVRDQAGNQWIMLGTAVGYGAAVVDLAALSESARRGIESSQHLRNALWLNGRANHTVADFYMIHEYAMKDLKGNKNESGEKSVEKTLVSRNSTVFT